MKDATVNRGLRTPNRLGFAALAVFVAALFVAIGAAAPGAKAETVGFKFDRGVINLGGEADGIWAKIVDPDLTPPDNPASINAEVAEDGTLTAAAADFFFPPKRIENLETGDSLLPVADANIAISAGGPISGNLEETTGEASIVLPASVAVSIYSAGSPTTMARCRISGFNLTLETTGQVSDPGDAGASPPRTAATYPGVPFAPPLKDGSVLASWESLPSAEVVSGGVVGGMVCNALNNMLGGPGSIWLSGKAGNAIELPPPDKAPKLTGTPASSTQQTSAQFSFEAGEGETIPVTGFECKFDGAAFAACDGGSQSYADLTVGDHTFTVRAKNDSGVGPETTYNWTVTKSNDPCPLGFTGTPPNCVKSPKKVAKLANLKIQPKNKTVTRGKSATVTVQVRNGGKAAAKGVKVCVAASKKLVQVKKCVTLGQVAAGKAKNAKFKVTVKKNAKKGQKAVLKFTATSNNAGKKAGKATVRIK